MCTNTLNWVPLEGKKMGVGNGKKGKHSISQEKGLDKTNEYSVP